jgi:hypothetical protein
MPTVSDFKLYKRETEVEHCERRMVRCLCHEGTKNSNSLAASS